MEYCDVEMVSKVLPGEDLTRMVKKIVNDFANEGMSRDEAVEILERLEYGIYSKGRIRRFHNNRNFIR